MASGMLPGVHPGGLSGASAIKVAVRVCGCVAVIKVAVYVCHQGGCVRVCGCVAVCVSLSHLETALQQEALSMHEPTLLAS